MFRKRMIKQKILKTKRRFFFNFLEIFQSSFKQIPTLQITKASEKMVTIQPSDIPDFIKNDNKT